MSFQSWCAEFYPVPADQVPEEEALVHSLRKWIGLREENLSRHDLRRVGKSIKYLPDADIGDDGCDPDDVLLRIDDDSCALCVHHAQRRDSCETCPLYKVLGDKPCDSFGGPYSQDFVDNDDVEPMIEALEAALCMVSEGNFSGGEDA